MSDHPPAAEAYPSFRLPSFPRPGPARRRSDIEQLEARCKAWLSRTLRDPHGDNPAEFERFLDQRTTLWTLLTYPTAQPDRIEAICNWIDVLFSLDDAFAHASPERMRQLGLHDLPAVINGRPDAADTPHIRALTVLWQHFRTDMPPALQGRFARMTAGFFDACRTERDWQDTRTAIGLSAYEKSRRRSIGECCFPLLEYGLDLDLTGQLADFPWLHRLDVLVARHWIGVNDIFSYRKELHSGDTMNEIALALADDDLQAAVDRVAANVRKAEDEFLTLREQLLAGPAGKQPGIKGYAEALGWMIAGNLEWSYTTTRYHGPGHVWNGCRDAIVTLTPQRTVFTTPPPAFGPA